MLATLRRRTALVAPALALTVALLAPSAAIAQQSQGVSIPIVGTVGGGGTFSGVFNLTSFSVQNGQVVANGTVSGLLTTATGVVTSVLQSVALPVSVTQATCQILHLDIGPIFLDLLGLQVDLSRIVLDITAVSGAGNLLGNLLCAVAGLLNNPGGLAALLNKILAAL
jgi:hypothetical protein